MNEGPKLHMVDLSKTYLEIYVLNVKFFHLLLLET